MSDWLMNTRAAARVHYYSEDGEYLSYGLDENIPNVGDIIHPHHRPEGYVNWEVVRVELLEGAYIAAKIFVKDLGPTIQ